MRRPARHPRLPGARAPLALLASFACLALACLALPAFAAEPPLPSPQGFVNDTAGAMGDWAAKTEALCREIERTTSAEVAVLTVKTTGGIALEDYAQRVFDRWGVGKKGKDNGILVLVAVDDRRMWIATGYGVEGILPDGRVGEIRDRAMLPLFREGRFGEGIHAGVSRLGDALRGEGAAPPAGPRRDSAYPALSMLFLAILILLALSVFRIFHAGRRGPAGRGYRRYDDGRFGGGGYWGGFGRGGFGGGGFGGFGGGGGGGGGAGGRW